MGGGRVSNCSMLEAIALCEEIAGRELDWTLRRSADRRPPLVDQRPEAFQPDYPDWSPSYDVPADPRGDPRRERRAVGHGVSARTSRVAPARPPQSLRDYYNSIAPEWDALALAQPLLPRAGQRAGGRRRRAGTARARHRLRAPATCWRACSRATGVGLNVAERLTELAREKYPELRFETLTPMRSSLPDGFRPDYVMSVNLLDHTPTSTSCSPASATYVSERTLIVITTSNPLWAPLLRLASRLGRRSPESPRNFITNRDIAQHPERARLRRGRSGARAAGAGADPGLSARAERAIPDLPVLRYVSSTQYLAARPRIARAPVGVGRRPMPQRGGQRRACAPAASLTWARARRSSSSMTARQTGPERRSLTAMEEDPRVRLVAYDTNHGKANAVRAGFDAARNDVLMILDADMTVAPEDLPKFLAPLQAGTADFVNGTRLVYPMAGQAMPTANFVGNKAFCLLVSWVLRQRVSDTLCGTKALLRRDYESMPLSGRDRWGDFDLLFGAARQKLRILEIPIHYHERIAGESKMNVRRDGPMFLRTCLEGWRHASPARLGAVVDAGADRGGASGALARSGRDEAAGLETLMRVYERALEPGCSTAHGRAAHTSPSISLQATDRGRAGGGRARTRRGGLDGARRRRQHRFLLRSLRAVGGSDRVV